MKKRKPHDIIGEAGPGQCGRSSRVAFVKHGEILHQFEQCSDFLLACLENDWCMRFSPPPPWVRPMEFWKPRWIASRRSFYSGRKFCNLIGFFHTPGFLRQFFVSSFPIFATGVRNQCGVHLSHNAVFVFFSAWAPGFWQLLGSSPHGMLYAKKAGLQHRLQLFATGMNGAWSRLSSMDVVR